MVQVGLAPPTRDQPVTGLPLFQRATLDLSLAMGCYNGGPQLEANLTKMSSLLRAWRRDYEIIVVEDGSQDGSAQALGTLERSQLNIRVLRNTRNMGKGFSIRKGVLHARGRHIIFTDADMTFAPQNLETVADRLDAGCQMVVANRRLPDSVYTVRNSLVRYVYRRHRTGLIFNAFIRALFGLQVRDTQCGLKGFSRAAAAAIFPAVHTHRYLFDVEIFILAKKLGIPMDEIPTHLTYETDYTTVKQLQYFFRLVPELSRIKLLELRGAYEPGTQRPVSMKEIFADQCQPHTPRLPDDIYTAN